MKYEKHVQPCQPEKELRVDSSWWRNTLDLLLPPHCVLCGRPCGPACLCGPCKADLPWTGWCCRHCGLPLGNATDEVCGGCIRKPPPFGRTLCPLHYRFPADGLVQSFKFRRHLAAGRVLSHLLAEWVIHQDVTLPDALIPVPLHNMRMIKRGFNQAFEMGSYIGRVLNIPLRAGNLRRRRNTAAQSGLSGKQRRRNVRGAFYWRGNERPGRHVALVDDVMTTATTVAECARALKNSGAGRVDVWVAARAIPVSYR